MSAFDLEEIGRRAGTTARVAGEILSEFLGIGNPSGEPVNGASRFRLALEAASRGALPEVARALTWQEFEAFSTECLSRAGFQTQKGLVFYDGERRWQMDIIARKSLMVLAIDCKHWRPPNYSSKFKKAAEHQRLALEALLHHRDHGLDRVWALPLILTLFEPRQRIIDKVVLVSVGQLPDFLEHVTEYNLELPFVRAGTRVESSISRPDSQRAEFK